METRLLRGKYDPKTGRFSTNLRGIADVFEIDEILKLSLKALR